MSNETVEVALPEGGAIIEGTGTQEVIPTIPETPGTTVTTEVPLVPEGDKPADKEAVPAEAISLDNAKFAGMDVDVSIPAEVVSFATQHGFDAKEIAAELYGSEDFTLSPETKGKLYEAFGQFQVDAYLDGIKMKNDYLIAAHQGEVARKVESEKQAWDATIAVMGGEDRWDDMSAFAMKTLPEDEVEEFNHVMEHGTLRMQQLMIKDLYSRYEAAGKPPAPTILELEEGGTTGVEDGSVALSKEQFIKIVGTKEYKANPAKYDALRRLGMQQGR